MFGGRSPEERDAIRQLAEASRQTVAGTLALQRTGQAQTAALSNLRIPPPTTNVRVEVNVTAAQVAKSVTVQRRYGPSGGSRDASPKTWGGGGV